MADVIRYPSDTEALDDLGRRVFGDEVRGLIVVVDPNKPDHGTTWTVDRMDYESELERIINQERW